MAESPSLAPVILLAIPRSSTPPSSLGFRVVQRLTWPAAWNAQRWTLVSGHTADAALASPGAVRDEHLGRRHAQHRRRPRARALALSQMCFSQKKFLGMGILTFFRPKAYAASRSGKDKLDFLLRTLKRIAARIPLETCSPGRDACAPYCNRALCT